jgi:hypothetical protein
MADFTIGLRRIVHLCIPAVAMGETPDAASGQHPHPAMKIESGVSKNGRFLRLLLRKTHRNRYFQQNLEKKIGYFPRQKLCGRKGHLT